MMLAAQSTIRIPFVVEPIPLAPTRISARRSFSIPSLLLRLQSPLFLGSFLVGGCDLELVEATTVGEGGEGERGDATAGVEEDEEATFWRMWKRIC